MTETTPTTTPTPPEGLTDARLLELAAAAIDGYDSIAPGEFEPEGGIAVEAYGSELIAAMRAAIAADRAERPAPTPEELEPQLLAWWAVPPHAFDRQTKAGKDQAVAFALHLLGLGVQ